MQDNALTMITFGLLFFAGLAADRVGRIVHVPRITLLLACGMIAGQAGFDLIPEDVTELYHVVSVIALTMVAFLLGSALSFDTLRRNGRSIALISIAVVVVTVAVVSLGLLAIGTPLGTALVLGGIAAATDPAATYDVIRQSGIDNRFTRTLKGIVAIDDAWGLLVFSVILVAVQTGTVSGNDVLVETTIEVAGSVALGAIIGLPAAFLTGRLTKGEPLRTEALGLVFLTAGVALWLNLSYLITGMTAGLVTANFARHHKRAFHEIENLQWPFMIMFFVLAGATLDPSALASIGAVGVAYIVFRIAGRIGGGWIGAVLAGTPARERTGYGLALLPQAGVAIGMALVAADQMPVDGPRIVALAIGTTVAFEVIGPVATGLAIRRSRAGQKKPDQKGS